MREKIDNWEPRVSRKGEGGYQYKYWRESSKPRTENYLLGLTARELKVEGPSTRNSNS